MYANIEAEIIQYLSAKFKNLSVTQKVPKNRPEQFVTVQRVGGGSDGLKRDFPLIAIQCWAANDYDASELALQIDSVMESMPYEVESCYKYARNSMTEFADPVSGQARYQISADMVTILRRQ